MSDLMSFSREDAEAFYRKQYVPANMTIAIVGDVKASEIVPVLDRYFGRLEKRPKPDPLRTVEPKQIAERTVVIPDRAQPVYVEGYHRPDALDKDDAVYAAIADVLSTGRTSRLYRSLVRDKKIAAQVGAFGGFPGDKYASMMLFFAIPAPGATNDQVRDAIRAEIDKIKGEPITDDELKMVKTRAKANLIRGLADNQGLAIQLASAQARFGDWREIFRSVEKIDAVTKEDITRVAQTTFTRTNRTVGILENSDQAAN
jgi:predicted Zn-dependent peptidase